jgi:hypothetical protein
LERLQALREPKPQLDAKVVREQLNAYLRDWQTLLRGHVYQAQQVLRRLVKGRLTFTRCPPSGQKKGTCQSTAVKSLACGPAGAFAPDFAALDLARRRCSPITASSARFINRS